MESVILNLLYLSSVKKKAHFRSKDIRLYK